MAILAAIDIGTNAVRLLIAHAGPDHNFKPLFSNRIITRLGEGVAHTGYLSPNAIERTLQVLMEYKRRIEEYGASQVVVIATGALRDAINRQDFIEKTLLETGFQVEVISGIEEAKKTLLGVMAGLSINHEPEVLVIDIGGGSTELIFARGREPEEIFSLPLGVVYLAEKYLIQDPINPDEYRALVKKVREELELVRTKIPANEKTFLLATAGTATTLAAIDLGLTTFDPAKIHQHSISQRDIARMLKDLGGMTLAERKAIPAIDRGREDLIIPGSVILLQTMQLFDINQVTVSEWGLREGLILSLMSNQC